MGKVRDVIQGTNQTGGKDYDDDDGQTQRSADGAMQ
jgi:hypothetical protein